MTPGLDTVLLALYASFAAGLGTSVGALAIFAARRLHPRTENILLSGAAGVMLAASFFALLQPAIVLATEQLHGPVAGVLLVIAGLPLAPVMAMAAGAMIFIISDEIIPETHRSGLEHVATLSLMSGFAVMLLLDAALG